MVLGVLETGDRYVWQTQVPEVRPDDEFRKSQIARLTARAIRF